MLKMSFRLPKSPETSIILPASVKKEEAPMAIAVINFVTLGCSLKYFATSANMSLIFFNTAAFVSKKGSPNVAFNVAIASWNIPACAAAVSICIATCSSIPNCLSAPAFNTAKSVAPPFCANACAVFLPLSPKKISTKLLNSTASIFSAVSSNIFSSSEAFFNIPVL